jgi:hypothetical protein
MAAYNLMGEADALKHTPLPPAVSRALQVLRDAPSWQRHAPPTSTAALTADKLRQRRGQRRERSSLLKPQPLTGQQTK